MSTLTEKLTIIAENQQKVYDAGYEAGVAASPQSTYIYENGSFTTASNITIFNKEPALYPGGGQVINGSGWEVAGLDFDNDGILVSWNAGKSGSIVSNAMIDFTECTKIRIDSAGIQGHTHLVKGVLYKLGTDGDLLNRVDEDAIVFDLNTDFDLSEISGEYYIGIFCSTDKFTQVKVTSIKLDKSGKILETKLSEILNYYTGETEKITSFSKLANKIDMILKSIGNDKKYFERRHYKSEDIIIFPKWDTSQATSLAYMYSYCGHEDAVFPELDASNCTSLQRMYEYTNAREYPVLINTNKVTNFSGMYARNPGLIEGGQTFPSLDTSNGVNFSSMYHGTEGKFYPSLNTSKGENFSHMFNSSAVIILPDMDTSNGTNFNSFCAYCTDMTTAKINLSNATNVSLMFHYCRDLIDLTIDGIIYISGIDLSYSSKLSHNSLMSVINALYDYSSDTSGATHSIVFGATNLAKLTDEEKAIATQKGWTLS